MTDETDTSPRLGSMYVLEERIGSGGMGTVWKGRHTESGEAVAIKMLADNLSQDPDIVTRFLRERTMLTSVSHPNLVAVRDLVAESDRLGLVMDLVEGSDASRLLESYGPFQASRVAKFAYEICQALAAIHAAGIVHRDLKPANIMIDDRTDAARLTDFGIAWLAGTTRVTAMNSVVGTPRYLAPELLSGGGSGPAADIYSLGICLYEFLTGTVPFNGEHYAQILQQHLYAHAQPHPAIPESMWPLIQATLAKNPAERPDAISLGNFIFTLLPELGAAGSVGPAVWPSTSGPAASTPVPAPPPLPSAQSFDPAASGGNLQASGSYATPYTEQPFEAENWPYSQAEAPYPGENPYLAGPGPFFPSEPTKRGWSWGARRRFWIAAISTVVVLGLGAGGAVFALGGTSKAAGPSPTVSAISSAPVVHTAAGPLVDQWLMTGNAKDQVGKRDGIVGNVKWTVLTDGTGSAGLFGEAGSQILVKGPVFDTERSFSLGVWANMNGGTSAPSGWETVVAQRGSRVDGAAIEYNPTANRWAFDMPQADSDTAAVDSVISSVTPSKTSWYHMIATYDGASHVMSFYINGKLQGTSVHATDWIAGGSLSIGAGYAEGAETNWLKGSLSDVEVWNKVLSADEVAGLG